GIAAVDAGALDLGDNGTFELGTSNGTGTGATLVLQTGTSITAAEVTLHSNATTILKIDAAGNTGSITADTLTIGGDLILDIDVGLIVETWTQFNFFDGAIGGQFSTITDSAGKYQWAFDAATGELSFASIPEPSTYALFGAIGAVGLALLRRKKKAAGLPSRTGL
ncbi:MAG: PEP-CTERM sorting domain-containing protein, partial [Puniceicoccales bacterium]|nr:PEP-CTERM sorting domain-containing protein [Puniceicoccales bacterium]